MLAESRGAVDLTHKYTGKMGNNFFLVLCLTGWMMIYSLSVNCMGNCISKGNNLSGGPTCTRIIGHYTHAHTSTHPLLLYLWTRITHLNFARASVHVTIKAINLIIHSYRTCETQANQLELFV